jgi:hypothetical protein
VLKTNLYVAVAVDRLGIVLDEDIPHSSFRVHDPNDMGRPDTTPGSHSGTLGTRK